MKSLRNGILLLFVVLLLVGCTSNSQHLDLAICGSYAVPGMFCDELKGGSYAYSVLETDRCGRILYTYTTQSVITGKDETVLVICQASDGKYVYFYEDICYLTEPWSAEEVAELKATNDWDQALNRDKMARRSNKVSFDLFIVLDDLVEYADVRQSCCEAFSISASQIIELCYLDSDSEQWTLYWLVFDRAGRQEKYFVMVDNAYTVCYEPAVGSKEDLTLISGLKQDNGWNY